MRGALSMCSPGTWSGLLRFAIQVIDLTSNFNCRVHSRDGKVGYVPSEPDRLPGSGLDREENASTMRVPMNDSTTINAYLAFRAVKLHNRDTPDAAIGTVLCPGLCTAIGRMSPELSARQMAAAFEACVLGRSAGPSGRRYLLGL